jgi:hypothetical protein
MEWARLHRRPVNADAGRLILDDTLAHHPRCTMDWLAYLWDPAEGQYAWAHDVVTACYVNRSDQFPVDLRLWFQFQAKKELAKLQQAAQVLAAQPTLEGYWQRLVDLLVFQIRQQLYPTKTVLAADLVQEAVDLRLPFSVVTFDSWFLHNDLIDPIEAVGKDWVGGCPQDRWVWFNDPWGQLQDYLKTIPPSAYRPTPVHGHLYWAFTKVLALKSLRSRRIRLVASFDNADLKGDPCLLGTNRKDWERTHILFPYSDRWPTETFNEDVKGHLGFEDYPLHKLRGIRRHWYLGFVAYSLLGDQGHPGRSRHGVRAPFESTGQRCQAVVRELLGDWVDWIALRLEEGVPAATITQMLLA